MPLCAATQDAEEGLWKLLFITELGFHQMH